MKKQPANRLTRITRTRMTALCLALLLSLSLAACSSGPPRVDEDASGGNASRLPSATQPPSISVPNIGYENKDSMPAPEYNDGYYDNFYDRSAGESYLAIDENRQRQTANSPAMTFSLKVDTAAYSNIERYITGGQLPPADAVRIEEMLNYFRYDAPMPPSDHPFSIYTEIGPSPFDDSKHMALVRVKSRDIDKDLLPPSNLTFLIDTSGSMGDYDKLPLLQDAFALLVDTLDEDDTVSIVTYAGSSAVLLDGVRGDQRETILNAIASLTAGGSTAGAQGIQTAYALAEKNHRLGGNNRVILATDGDFNVGVSSLDGLNKLISQQRDSGVYLSVLGFGAGNLDDATMETLAANGNGNYSYIHTLATAKKVLVDELAANLYTIADDVKAQIEFNPDNVEAYRLIGYENRTLENRDFEDDAKDAGDIGMDTDTIILLELTLRGSGDDAATLKYPGNQPSNDAAPNYADELFEVRIRYKNPGQSQSRLMLHPVACEATPAANSADYGFACAVASFGHLLRQSPYSGKATLDAAMNAARANLGEDAGGYRIAFLDLLRRYQGIVQ